MTENDGTAAYLSEEGVVDLFRSADFHCFHHLAGGDDGAAEGLRSGRHDCWEDGGRLRITLEERIRET